MSLFPPIEPYHRQYLDVGDDHLLYVEQSGNPDGEPVVALHGGPGGGCEDYHRRFFDAERFRIILMDQRGAGRSSPLAELEGNSTDKLVEDMEVVRSFLGIDKWLLFGGSWGATLSLVYAEAHPERVSGLVLRGIFLCRPRDIHWFYQEGASRVFPDYWSDFEAQIPEADRADMVSAYYRKLTSSNELEQIQAAKAWSVWEGRCATLHPNPRVVEHFGHPHVAIALARIECHYFMNSAFLEPDQIIHLKTTWHDGDREVNGQQSIFSRDPDNWSPENGDFHFDYQVIATVDLDNYPGLETAVESQTWGRIKSHLSR